MVEEELSQYEEILECDDWDIFHWLTGDVPIPANLDNSVMRNLKGFQFSQ
jgi:succinate dehydrogenase flavin-adding protein (antitoxin of CptAB toxin-antitoxin module)